MLWSGVSALISRYVSEGTIHQDGLLECLNTLQSVCFGRTPPILNRNHIVVNEFHQFEENTKHYLEFLTCLPFYQMSFFPATDAFLLRSSVWSSRTVISEYILWFYIAIISTKSKPDTWYKRKQGTTVDVRVIFVLWLSTFSCQCCAPLDTTLHLTLHSPTANNLKVCTQKTCFVRWMQNYLTFGTWFYATKYMANKLYW